MTPPAAPRCVRSLSEKNHPFTAMNTTSPSQMLRYLPVKIAAGSEPSRDGYGWHPLQEGRALLAWVADAPDSASQESAERIRHAVSLFLTMSPGNEERLAMPSSETEARARARCKALGAPGAAWPDWMKAEAPTPRNTLALLH